MTLRLQYQGQTSVPVEVEGLLPERLKSLSLAEIERVEIFHGNEKLPLAELFSVAGDPSDARLEFAGDLAGVHWIGAGMTGGEIHVVGNVGRHLGSEMSGGEIHVAGDASDWVGAELHGGLVHVRGNAGHLVGSVYRGGRWGMTGGAILIDGDAGDEIGHTMRRGLLAVGGACGDFVGLNMIAGTILIFSGSGAQPAAGMRRGTLGLFGANPTELLPTFRAGTRYQPLFLQLMFRELRRRKFAVSDELLAASYRLYHGDMVAAGRGEILMRAGA